MFIIPRQYYTWLSRDKFCDKLWYVINAEKNQFLQHTSNKSLYTTNLLYGCLNEKRKGVVKRDAICWVAYLFLHETQYCCRKIQG